MHKLIEENMQLILALIFGGIFSILSVILFHTGHFVFAILCLIPVAIIFIVNNDKSYPIILGIFFASGILELLVFDKSQLAIVFIILALVAFFLPKFE
jgi:hypothetical protein